mgnify:CR=1 FL=1|jgi:hypothetical protein
MFEQKNGQKPGKSSPAFRFSDTLSQSIGRGRISRERPLVVRESREWRDIFFAGKQHAIVAQNFTNFRSETTVPNFNGEEKNLPRKSPFFLWGVGGGYDFNTG